MEALPRGEERYLLDCWHQGPPPPGPCPATADDVSGDALPQTTSPVSLQVTLFFSAPVSRLSMNRSPGLSCPELEAGLSL